MMQTMKRVGKGILKFLLEIAAAFALLVVIDVLVFGMELFGLPSQDEVQSVSIAYPSVTEEVKEFSDEENVETALNLTGYLKYNLFKSADTTEEPLITITYHLTDRTDFAISANKTTVWWKDKAYAIKDEGMFVKLTNGCFFSEASQTE